MTTKGTRGLWTLPGAAENTESSIERPWVSERDQAQMLRRWVSERDQDADGEGTSREVGASSSEDSKLFKELLERLSAEHHRKLEALRHQVKNLELQLCGALRDGASSWQPQSPTLVQKWDAGFK
eukprot:CAMPEP_0180669304 /NCGR_PEP_ID=MMETSP1037_2-20121125/63405_1 /TAXON_ID=632150 /ORGANISM="Azadinium spinosum, Strain 3D9" /LENGTH=124 /DNA_ID=CAMNT_0022698127 /DNA_START=8 /DNA_END=379 /DNA_ORIENTATION=+